MRKKLLLRKLTRVIAVCAAPVLFSLYGCAPSGMVIDKDAFQTPVKRLYLKEEPYLKVWHGGIIQKIPLSKVQMVKISEASSMVIGDDIYFSGEVIFKNGSKIQTPNDKTRLNPVFISIHNTLIGKSKEQIFSISLENVTQIQIKK